MSFGARALIRLAALAHNFHRIREAARGANVMAVVKGNAYGHGLASIATNLPDADSFAVARFSEACALSAAGVTRPVVLLQGVANAEQLMEALARGYELVVHCERQLAMLEQARTGRATVWLKVDTGMHRLGFPAAAVSGLLARLEKCRAVGELRLMTHLANADHRDDLATERQLETFRGVLRHFDGHVSVANSAGLLGWPESVCAGSAAPRSWVRAGICLYGVSPFPGTTGRDFGLQPVMEFGTSLIDVKPVRAAERVGYGGSWQATGDTVLGIVAAGYGDGYSRFIPSGTPVLVGGRRAKVAGRISMDMAAIDLGPDATDDVGAPVTLWGDSLPVEEVAAYAGTIPYQLLAGITHREASEITV